MTAYLNIDDTYQAYSQGELAYLVRLAALLPDGVVLRAAHEHNIPSPINIAIDLRLCEQLTIRPDLTEPFDPANEALLKRSVQKLAESSRKALQGVLGRMRQPGDHDCPRCQRPMRPRYSHSKQNVGRPDGYVCDRCGDPDETDEAFALALSTALSERGSPYRRFRK